MAIIQKPSDDSLSSMLADFIITSTSDLVFELRKGNETILKEVYTPDAEGRIYIRGYALGRTLAGYLYGNDLAAGTQGNVFATFTAYINNVLQHTFRVLRSTGDIGVAAAGFFSGGVFLARFDQVKWTRPEAVEYLTSYLSAASPVRCNVIYRSGNDIVAGPLADFRTGTTNNFVTYDASFATVAARFPSVNRNNILAYKLHLKNQVYTYYVDRAPCLHTLTFRYKNGFDVPDSIITRGAVSRKGNTSYETTLVNGITQKFNVQRSDTFTVSSGKIFAPSEYGRYREMLASEDVRVLFRGKYRKIIITEEETEEPLRTGSLAAVGFSFIFADQKENDITTAESFLEWILTPGDRWIDNNVWIDVETWNDDALIP